MNYSGNRNRKLVVLGAVLFASFCLFIQPSTSLAQQTTPAGQVVIKRDAIHLIPPEQFRVPISLQPTRQLSIRSLVEGLVQSVRVKPGAKVSSQEEVLRIESAKPRNYSNERRQI